MCEKYNRCRYRTCNSKLVLVVVLAVTVTAPLIQNVVCLANDAKIPRTVAEAERAAVVVAAAAADISAAPASVELLPPFATLLKRDAASVGGSDKAGSTEDDDDGSRIARNGGDLDFDAYVNDFNMQEETSIPEDIVDQQHIQDGDLQYATEPEATDVVLKSESRNSEKLSTFGINKNENDNKKITKVNKNKKVKNKINDKNVNREKLDNKREENNDDDDELAIVDYDGDGDDSDRDSVDSNEHHNGKGEMESGKNNDNDDEMAIVEKQESGDIVKQHMGMDMGNEEDVYKKFKEIKVEKIGQHERQQQYEQQQNQQQRQQHQAEQQYVQKQHQKQLHAVFKLNERKFNKFPSRKFETIAMMMKKNVEKNERSGDDTIKNSKAANKRYEEQKEEQDKNWQSYEDDYDAMRVTATASAAAPIAAIGDIEDNFRNEDEAKAKAIDAKKQRMENFENDYGNNNSNIDENNDDANDGMSVNDKSVAAKKAAAATSQISPNVIELKVQKSSGIAAAKIVGRKSKRFNRVRTFNSGNNSDHLQQSYLVNYDIGSASDKNNKRHKEHESNAAASSAIKRSNGSNTFKDTRNVNAQEEQPYRQQQQQQQEDEFAAVEVIADLATVRGSGSSSNSKLNHESAFEKHKARRRNNRHNGHKSHKKRYKDYLRFAMTPQTTPTITVPLATTKTTAIETTMQSKNTNEQSAIAAKVAAAASDQAFTNGTNNHGGGGGAAETKATSAILTNNLKGIYENTKYEAAGIENIDANVRRAEKLRKYARKLQAEKSRGLPTSPIFAVASNTNAVSTTPPRQLVANPTRPFYEGQINYYMETKEDEPVSGELLTDTSNWYRRVSPVLRNGIKTSKIEVNEPPFEHRRKHHHHQHHNHHQHNHDEQHKIEFNKEQHHQHHHHHRQHQHQFHHHQHNPQRMHHKHQQTNEQYQTAQSNPYQRKLVRKPVIQPSSITSNIPVKSHTYTSTPMPPPAYKPHEGAMQELGHQITEMEELERYYAKWPHLARVQLQVYDEHFREEHPEIYPDYDQDYESAAELEEAQNANAEDANLPPYIKKYNRRNKQLLNLLEGTLPPPTKSPYYMQGRYGSLLQPGPHESSGHTVVRIDDEYMKAKRRRYHNRYGNGSQKSNNNNKNNDEIQHDLFAQQRNDGSFTNSNENATATSVSTTSAAAKATGTLLNNQQKSNAVTQKTTTSSAAQSVTQITTALQNQLPEEDVSITQEERDEQESDAEATDWQKEIEKKLNGNAAAVASDDDEMTGNIQMTWQIEKLTTPSSSTTKSTMKPKSALFRLPSYPAISGSYIGKARSRSSQFAPSSHINAYVNMYNPEEDYNFEKARHIMSGVNLPPPSPPPQQPQQSFSQSTTAPGIQTVSDIPQWFTQPPPPSSSQPPPPPPSKNINSFVYHRVVDSAPRFVGAGTTGLKQRLPFVAITDRRLETAKKTLLEHKKDLEQNFYPMP